MCKPTINRGTIQERARRELAKEVGVKGHAIEVPKVLTGNWSGTCRNCGKTVVVRFDVPCGWLVAGAAAGSACHYGRGF